ncbi:hypothetical protein NDI45_22460 [Leptolyngbya sp. GB1-A1]
MCEIGGGYLVWLAGSL